MKEKKIRDAILDLKAIIEEERIDPQEGLPLELFEFCSTLLPFVNVDLFITNEKDEILLSWRDDSHYGTGWHIPGGIIRMMETIDERIQKTAVREIGCEVYYEKKPIIIYENLIREYRAGIENQFERAHNISLIYRCKLPNEFEINNTGKNEKDEGYLRWFTCFPNDILECHKGLKKYEYFNKWF